MSDDYEIQFKDKETDQAFSIRMYENISKITATAERVEALLVQEGYVEKQKVEINPEAAGRIEFTVTDEENDAEVQIEMRGSRTQIRETASKLQNLFTKNGFEVD